MNSAEYKYVSSLDNPQTYQYTKFLGKEFIRAYKLSRLHTLNMLPSGGDSFEKTLQDQIHVGELTTVQLLKQLQSERDTRIALLMMLRLQNARHAEDDKIGEEIERRLVLFVKKYEVSKKIYSHYDDTMRRASDECSALDLYVLLAVNLALCYRHSRRLPFLNTVLKINDMLCGTRDRIPLTMLPFFRHALIVELEEVYCLSARKRLMI